MLDAQYTIQFIILMEKINMQYFLKYMKHFIDRYNSVTLF